MSSPTRINVSGKSAEWIAAQLATKQYVTDQIAASTTFQWVVKTASESRSLKAGTVNDGKLAVPGLLLGNSYRVYGRIKYSAPAGVGIACRLNAAHATADGWASGLDIAATAGSANQLMRQQEVHAANAQFGTFGSVGVGVTCPMYFDITLTMTDVSGSVAFAWDQAASNATPTIVLINSEMSVVRLPTPL